MNALMHVFTLLAKTFALKAHGFNPIDWVFVLVAVVCLLVWIKKDRKKILHAIQADHPEAVNIVYVEHSEFTGFPETTVVRNQDGSETKYKFESTGKWSLSK